MKKTRPFFVCLAVLLLFSATSFAYDLASRVRPFKLSNGMRWLLVERPELPIFSGLVMVRAGGVDESAGKTGLAHMFEHMAFKGSPSVGTSDYQKELPLLKKIARLGREMSAESQKENPDPQKIAELKKQIEELNQEQSRYIVKDEVWQTLTQKGASDLNAFTTKDATAYHASMPRSEFPLWASLFSEMVFRPVMREFYQERDVVMEERRLRYDNSPQGFLLERLIELAFPKGPYHWAPIGHAKDLQGLTVEDAQAFHRKFYIPRNIAGVLVGDIPLPQAKSVLEKYFGRFPARPSPGEVSFKSFAFQGGKKEKVAFDAEPLLAMAFYKPRAPARDDYLFDMFYDLLCDGRTARFPLHLVKEQKVATSVYCSVSFPGNRLDNLFVIFAAPGPGKSLEALEEAINRELEKIGEDLQESELERVRAQVLYDSLWNLEDNMELAEQLATAEAILNDWRYVPDYSKVIGSVSREELVKAAKKYFRPENRVVLYRVRGN